MTATIPELVTEYDQALGAGRLDRVAELLQPDLVFGGATAAAEIPGQPLTWLAREARFCRDPHRHPGDRSGRGSGVYPVRLGPRYPAGVVLSGALVRIEDGLIQSITLIFDWRRWPEVLQEVGRRATASAEANR